MLQNTPNYGFHLHFYFICYCMTDREGQEGKITALTFFIFICSSVVALSVLREQLPCSVDCDVGVNLSAAHLLFLEIIWILAFT